MKDLAKRPMFSPQQVQFVCEQDGGPERELKERLVQSLGTAGVRKAYLARVAYDERKRPHGTGGTTEPETSVALCVTLDETAEKHEIVERAGRDFAALFGPTQHMDIVFLTDQQELALGKVCRPFYIAMDPA